MAEIIRGTGITKRRLNVFEGKPGELSKIAERRGFERKIVELEPMARDILIKAGYDPENVRLGPEENDTPPAYAYEMLNRIKQIRADIAGACADDAARWAFELGYLCCEFGMKLEVEKPALHGQKNLARLERMRENSNGSPFERQHRWSRQCAEFDAARERGLKQMAAYKAAALQCGVSSKTIQRSVKRRNKKL